MPQSAGRSHSSNCLSGTKHRIRLAMQFKEDPKIDKNKTALDAMYASSDAQAIQAQHTHPKTMRYLEFA